MGVAERAQRPPGAAVAQQGYFFEDPIRFLCIVSAVLLMFLPAVPFWLIFLAVGVSQFNSIVMVARVFSRGRIQGPPGGAHGRYWTVQHLGTESFTLSACTLLGGLLLLRLFGPPEPAMALGALTIALALVPDIRVCRWMMPRDPFRANRALERGPFLRDPVKLGAILSAFILCMLDPDSVVYVLLSMLLLQSNALLVLIDKYAACVEWRREGHRVPLTRDSWRVVLSVLPLGVLPLRALAGEEAGWYGAGAVAGLIVLPDLARLAYLLYLAAFARSVIVARRSRRRLALGAARAKVTVLGFLFAVPLVLRLAWGSVRTAACVAVVGRRPAPVIWNSVARNS